MCEPIKVLVIGVGSIGERHLRSFQATGRVNLSLCEVDSLLRERIASEYNIGQTYADLKTALTVSHDAAVVATPANSHVSIARSLCQAGMHMLIEKPLSTSLDGISALQQDLISGNLVVDVGYVLRYQPALCAMKEAITAGRFGRPLQLTAVSGQHFPTFRPAYQQIYYANRASGGGAIQDALTHVVNAGQWLVGPIDRLVADANRQALEGVSVEDTVHVIARHGELLASYSLNQHQAPNESTITVVCQRGTCRLELHRECWAWMTEPNTEWQTEYFEPLGRDGPFTAQANAFLDVIQGRANPKCMLQEAVQTLNVSLAILASVDDGNWKSVA